VSWHAETDLTVPLSRLIIILVEEGKFEATDGSLYQNSDACKLWIPQTNLDDSTRWVG